eukprot:4714388-Amphidinium_carterae.1
MTLYHSTLFAVWSDRNCSSVYLKTSHVAILARWGWHGEVGNHSTGMNNDYEFLHLTVLHSLIGALGRS